MGILGNWIVGLLAVLPMIDLYELLIRSWPGGRWPENARRRSISTEQWEKSQKGACKHEHERIS